MAKRLFMLLLGEPCPLCSERTRDVIRHYLGAHELI